MSARRAEPALGGQPGLGLREHLRPSRRSARTRSCASRSITGGTSVAKRSAWPTSSTPDRARQPLQERVRRRLVHEHARGRGALLAGVAERRVHDLRHDVVEVGVGVHDHAVLSAHLGHDPLHVALALGRLGGGAQDLEPDGARAGEGDHVHARVAHERGPHLAVAGKERERVARHAGRVERLDERAGARGRLLGRLQHRRVPGRERGGGHAARDGEREVPGRDHRCDAARRVAHGVPLARHLDERAALVERDRLERVVLEEVDRLAHVAIRLRPRLRALAHLKRRELEPPLAQDLCGAAQDLRPLGG